MYLNYFGLHTEPFSIAPDPQFLYLSERHQEALAHLNYGIQGSGGFILLTGEVGTGKTTVSRALLEQLPDGTRTAFILNPMLSSNELLETLCDEFGVERAQATAVEAATTKQLTDDLSKFLLAAHEQHEECVVLIDEAQHLHPQVLEQLRLLTNLETNERKLLRVILIGQPELQDLLRRRELRQLAQRITARYHLLPLQLSDTERYINYRLQVAGAERGLFDLKAIQLIHKLSEGIPRRLNLLGDRALLAAYNDQAEVVTSQHIKQAQQEVDGATIKPTTSTSRWWSWAAAASIVVAVNLGYFFWFEPPTAASVETKISVQEPPEPAVLAMAKVWQLPLPSPEQPLCNWIENYQLLCVQGQARFDQLRQINLPMLLDLSHGAVQFIQNNEELPAASWNGSYTLVIPQPPGYQDDQDDLYQQWLAAQLERHGAEPAASFAEQLRQLQLIAGLPVSGELNGLTLAWLTAHGPLGGPRLANAKEGS